MAPGRPDKRRRFLSIARKYWFLIGLALVLAVTLGDVSGVTAETGRWLKQHQGPNIVICLVFLFSGILLDTRQIREGLADWAATLQSLFLIFAAAPVIGWLMSLLPVASGIRIGLFLVAVMPTTMSSGVVMTGAAGGRMAHALVITIFSNILSVFTIPLTLSLLLETAGNSAAVMIDKGAVMAKIGLFVVLPLAGGLVTRSCVRHMPERVNTSLKIANQLLILAIVWMGIAQSRPILLETGSGVGSVVFTVTGFHLLLLLAAWALLEAFRVRRGRRESILFMGIQKTLPLSVILQVSLFPEYGLALLVCVAHHFISLMIDGFLVGRLRPEGE